MKIADHLGLTVPRIAPDEALMRAFQEKGRDISARVREIGGTGLSNEIRKALAEAYAIGVAVGRGDLALQPAASTTSSTPQPYNMSVVPPNARSCFERLAYRLHSVDKITTNKSLVFIQAKRTILDGPRTTKWFLCDYTVEPPQRIGGSSHDDLIGGLTLSPLVKHGLLLQGDSVMVLSDIGMTTLNYILAKKKAGIQPYQLKWPAHRNG